MMKNKLAYLLILVIATSSLTSCFSDQDDEIQPASTLEIQDFVWRGLNIFYLYKEDISALDETNYASQAELDNFLDNYANPEDLFDALMSSQDRFSFIVSDYTVLEDALAGTSKSNGMEYGLVQLQSTGEVFGYVRYVLPNTDAEDKGVERGMIFNRIDGTAITTENYSSLLASTTYTIGLASFENSTLTELDETISLTKSEYTEDPVYIAKTIELADKNVGYLMYNAFNNNFDNTLNNAFANFKGEGITDLVIDLRYNGGGSIETSNDLASMVTGQFNGELFTTQVYNENFDDVERLFNNEVSTGATINSLNLNKVYILTTGSTASASELIISSLLPYIEVVQIGTTTTGKFQGSVTLYDSADFSRSDASINHKYAMQPLILKTVNANGYTDYVDGITPSIIVEEDYANLGVLGDVNEPLLAAALNDVSLGRFTVDNNKSDLEFKEIGESDMNALNYQRMYINTAE
ncbi:C-terminal processing protease CtpA/Prc, contains a PDZ domain [Mesonia phycicola]|uniref:C-terminal processing protease CtpA/Prc, contains a PDZ domain n=1 Tax=Mesonia phycicola TaxID=579105 RepID=A0A1M6BQT6_9FLAO|nr:S41 family peptidase [Mesonia phycicola]SHI51077.1 C-terminal processing protease CtpA/Prc, contains a PDZ domain [Mesonia phycicola]